MNLHDLAPLDTLLPALFMGLALLAQALFVGSEMALTALDRVRLEHIVARKPRYRILLTFLDHPTWVLGATLVGANLALATLAAIGIYYLFPHLGSWSAGLMVLALPITLIFGDIIPKTLFQAKPLPFAITLIWPLRLIGFLMSPFLHFLARISQLSTPESNKSPGEPLFVLREELKLRIQEESSTPELKPLERHMLTRIFEFKNITVGQIMIPLADAFLLSDTSPLKDAVSTLADQGFSRLPVCQNRAEKVIGIINAFDILFEEDLEQPIRRFLRPAYFIPESMPIPRLLLELRHRKTAMAIVVNEYGQAQGIATLEDVLEEIVGDIEDEYDRLGTGWKRISPKELRLNARMKLQDLESLTNVTLPRGTFETVGGLLLSSFGQIPKVGAQWHYDHLTFVVRATTERSIQEVSVIDGRI